MHVAEGKVHVWRIATDRSYDLPALRSVLSEDEIAKADRFRFENDRRRAVLRRAALRQILARYAGASPNELRFVYGPQGKPALDAAFLPAELHFNLSFSGELALCAVGRWPLGIDVERERQVENANLVAKHFFTAAEIALQDAAGDPNRVFLRHWTRKEALIKATGSGLSVPLNSFDVSGGVRGQGSGFSGAQAELTPSSQDVACAQQVSLPNASGETTAWWLYDLAPPAGWCAALATLKPIAQFEWHDADKGRC
ncbi:MAG TPA: 4'-phosphopantetheinyl transferase superfamily protein [Pirellulales bacterium]|nr:4'-phosphopantetheinyl transferase superfamily protein [Pirellulales bacterium]